MKRLLSIIVAMAFALCANLCIANAQTTVKSITSEKKYTDKQIRAILGNPNSYDTQKGNGETLSYYYYKDAEFTFSDGRLLEMGIRTNKFPVMTDKVSEGVKVGDNISKVLNLKNIVWWKPDADKHCYIIYFDMRKDQHDYIIYEKNGIINKILFITGD